LFLECPEAWSAQGDHRVHEEAAMDLVALSAINDRMIDLVRIRLMGAAQGAPRPPPLCGLDVSIHGTDEQDLKWATLMPARMRANPTPSRSEAPQ
jgi:hypothetical protein